MIDAELEGFRPDRYFARSWALLTRDRGWVKPVLILFLACLVPFVGPIGALGYVIEWARLTAWGVNSSPKQKRIQVGACIVSGWRAFIVLLVWGICSSLITGLLSAVPMIGPILTLAWSIFSIFFGLVMMVAALRTAIYQSISAGFNLVAIWKMATSDVAGLMRIFGMRLAGSAIVGVVLGLVCMGAIFALVPRAVEIAAYVEQFRSTMSDSLQMQLFFELVSTIFSAFIIPFIVTVIFGGIASVILMMLSYTAIALWMRQFDVASWGGENDPLPSGTPSWQGTQGQAYGSPWNGGPQTAATQPGYWQQPGCDGQTAYGTESQQVTNPQDWSQPGYDGQQQSWQEPGYDVQPDPQPDAQTQSDAPETPLLGEAVDDPTGSMDPQD